MGILKPPTAGFESSWGLILSERTIWYTTRRITQRNVIGWTHAVTFEILSIFGANYRTEAEIPIDWKTDRLINWLISPEDGGFNRTTVSPIRQKNTIELYLRRQLVKSNWELFCVFFEQHERNHKTINVSRIIECIFSNSVGIKKAKRSMPEAITWMEC